MTNIDQIQLKIITGNNDLKRNHRVFLGFSGRQGREYRCRENNGDGNPFKSNSTVILTFGNTSNVEKPELNDPRNPPTDDLQIGRAYLRIDPNTENKWLIQDAQVSINGTLTHRLRIPNIILDEDGSEIVYLD
ncbi:MAG TPA: hypothetical protein VFT71_02485 [Candidatus Nitrosocosmicus sp.]|nr:hypothetical protein [Candidatus Nitrosocosmicus sp.]